MLERCQVPRDYEDNSGSGFYRSEILCECGVVLLLGFVGSFHPIHLSVSIDQFVLYRSWYTIL